MAILRRIIDEEGSDFTVHLFERATHGMRDFESGDRIPAVEECIVPWLRKNVGFS